MRNIEELLECQAEQVCSVNTTAVLIDPDWLSLLHN
jgi:hypothetical protein